MAFQPRAPAAGSESSEAKLPVFAAGRDLKDSMIYCSSTASGSSTAGTFSSATYTSSRASVLSSELDLASQLQCIDDDEEMLARTKRLAEKFCHGDGDIATLEKWLSQMGVGWVLDLADDPSTGISTSLLRAQPQRDNLTESWIRGLTAITAYIHRLKLYLRLSRLVRAAEERGTDVMMLQFVDATILKMLPFVDALLAADASTDTTADVINGGLRPLFAACDALSRASKRIQLCFYSAEMDAQRSRLLSRLSEKEHRLEEAIWNKTEEVRIRILNDDDEEEWGIQTSQASPDICKVTRSLMTSITSLWDNYYSRLKRIVRAAAELGSYVPNRDITFLLSASAEEDENSPHITLQLEMVSSLEVKLAKRSESFPDHSLRFLFLIKNTHFIQQQLFPFFSKKNKYKDVLGLKIEDYTQKYLQASWVPIMLCLHNDRTPRWFRKKSALPKFDLEFVKTYTSQKLWKVLDPELRTSLRKSIIKEVVPGLTRYLEDNNITSPGVSLKEREEMLLELFEG